MANMVILPVNVRKAIAEVTDVVAAAVTDAGIPVRVHAHDHVHDQHRTKLFSFHSSVTQKYTYTQIRANKLRYGWHP